MSASVTVVIVPREQFGRARLSLQSVLDSTVPDCPIIYVDGNSPQDLARDLAITDRITMIRQDHYLSGNAARNLALPQVRTKYVLFIDNDVQMWPGSIDAMVKCADETGAWVVGSLYCIGAPGSRKVHSAGGEVRIVEKQGRRHIYERQLHCGERADEVRAMVGRSASDQVEFHCMMVRAAAFERFGPLDEGLRAAFDHVDLCLAVRNANHPIYVETAATVTYLPPPPIQWSDLPFFLVRWSEAWYQSSLHHFCEKWQLDPDDEVFRVHENYRLDHRARILTQSSRMNRIIEGSVGKILEKTLVKNLERRHHPGKIAQSHAPLAPN
jgi:GT2 family glycosyltransferase